MGTEQTIFVVDDEPAVRDALELLMESVRLPVETFSSAEEFLEVYDGDRPGCLILDVRLPGMSGFELQERLASEPCPLPIIMITGFGDISMAVRAIENGAIDYITKPFNEQILLERVRQGLRQCEVTRQKLVAKTKLLERYETLTRREREVMALVVQGKANKMIAAELGVSCKTVEGHRAHVMEKMGADSLATLVRLGLMLERAGEPPRYKMGKRRYMVAAI